MLPDETFPVTKKNCGTIQTQSFPGRDARYKIKAVVMKKVRDQVEKDLARS